MVASCATACSDKNGRFLPTTRNISHPCIIHHLVHSDARPFGASYAQTSTSVKLRCVDPHIVAMCAFYADIAYLMTMIFFRCAKLFR